MGKINLNLGDSIVTKNQNGMKGIPVDARTQVQYYKDIQNIEYAYENLQVIVTDDDPTDSQHPKGIYVITKLDGNNNVDPSGIKSLKETIVVTKQDVGLENVDNVKQIPASQKGTAGGVAELNENGKIPESQLPSYVDDVIEGYLYEGSFYTNSSYTQSITKEVGKIYVDLSTNNSYRWSGSQYTQISSGLQIGTTRGTAFEGSRGAAIELIIPEGASSSDKLVKQSQIQNGNSAYLHIMYSRNMPISDSDISSTFEAGYRYIGICTDNNQTAPSTYESYQWAKFVGNDGIGGGLTTEERAAIVALFKAAVYTSGTGIDDLIDVIENPPITKTVIGLTVSVQSPQPNVYAGQNLDDVKPYLTVTASYDDNTSAVVTTYTLSGDISTTGTKQITASYTENGVTVTDTFDLVVSVAPTLYQVTNNLTNCTSNGSSSVYEHNQYQAVITPNNGYTLTGATVTVTMDGNDITSTSYSNGVVTIADVTGDIVITISVAAKVLTGITATLDAQTPNFSVGDSLSVIKPYLTVTAQYSNAPDDTLADTDYTLSSNDGDTLIVGSNTITVTYQSQTDSISVNAVAAPVFFDKLEFSGGAYIETDIVPPTDFSVMLKFGNPTLATGSDYSPQGILSVGTNGGRTAIVRTKALSSQSTAFYDFYYGNDTSSKQLNANFNWNPMQVCMTPNIVANVNTSYPVTKGTGIPSGNLKFGAVTGLTNATTFKDSLYFVDIYDADAVNDTFAQLLERTPLYTFRPCTYNGEAGMWCAENGKFYGNSASVGTLTAVNNE